MNLLPAATPARLAVLALAASLAGCSTIEGFFSGDKADYKSTAAKSQPLEVPPDLTQLARESRYQPQGGVISASGVGAPAAAGPGSGVTNVGASGTVAPSNMGDLRIERDGQARWLVAQQTPETLWPLVKAFWEQRGIKLESENQQTGVMETEWVENRTKLPNDLIRNTIGKVFGNLYDSGLRDRYRTRIERTATGSEIYISHRGLQEVYLSERQDGTVWRNRPSDPQLEAEMLASLMVALTNKPEQLQAKAGAPAASAASVSDLPAKVRVAETSQATSLVIEEPFDRAWRRVGLALDRGGFTVEDRDRASGLYYVRYIDPKYAGKEEPSWWSKLWNGGVDPQAALRCRVALKAAGDKTNLTVQASTGALDTGENAKRIVGLLVNDLK